MNQRAHAKGVIAFGKEELKTSEQVAEFMKKEFPDRDSKIFEYPKFVLVVLTVADRRKKHSFKKFPTVKELKAGKKQLDQKQR